MEKQNLKQKWSDFLTIFFSPGSIIPLSLGILFQGLAIFSFSGSLSNLLSISASILTAIAGFFIKDDWDKLQGNSMLEKKGKSAFRNLSSINQQVNQFRSWIKSFISKKQTTKRELEEMDRHLSTIQTHIESGLADWIDIVPELKEKAEVSKNYDDTIKAYIEERLENQKKLLNAGTNKELKEQLEARIKELEERVKTLRKEQYGVLVSSSVSPSVGTSPLLSAASPSPISVSDLSKRCIKCGKNYVDDFSSFGSLLSRENICSECKSKFQ